jgi:hypothetical protein
MFESRGIQVSQTSLSTCRHLYWDDNDLPFVSHSRCTLIVCIICPYFDRSYGATSCCTSMGTSQRYALPGTISKDEASSTLLVAYEMTFCSSPLQICWQHLSAYLCFSEEQIYPPSLTLGLQVEQSKIVLEVVEGCLLRLTL